jgi:hypothetical protein
MQGSTWIDSHLPKSHVPSGQRSDMSLRGDGGAGVGILPPWTFYVDSLLGLYSVHSGTTTQGSLPQNALVDTATRPVP